MIRLLKRNWESVKDFLTWWWALDIKRRVYYFVLAMLAIAMFAGYMWMQAHGGTRLVEQ